MRKNGFTLTEILLALGIVGVIAALTIPSLVSSYQNRVQATALSTAVTNFETAMRSMIQAEDAIDLRNTETWIDLGGSLTNDNADQFMADIKKVLDISDRVDKHIDRNDVSDFGFRMSPVVYFIEISDNAQRYPQATRTEADNIAAGINIPSIAAKVVIDTNGAEAPNLIGRDIFYFYLGSDGVLYPFGGEDVEIISQTAYPCDGVGSVGCTARLIENGYVMDY